MERVGFLQFTLNGQPFKLSALVDAGTTRIQRLSVLFADLTNGTETYQAGRYIDLDPTPTGIYVIDFNLAYQPSLLLQPRVRVPVSSSGKPVEGADSCR